MKRDPSRATPIVNIYLISADIKLLNIKLAGGIQYYVQRYDGFVIVVLIASDVEGSSRMSG